MPIKGRDEVKPLLGAARRPKTPVNSMSQNPPKLTLAPVVRRRDSVNPSQSRGK